MDKKLSPGKAVGIVFCILAGICTVVLLFMDGYFSGQMKVIDKYWTSIARGDFNGCNSCILAEAAENITEADFEYEMEWLQYSFGDEEVKTNVKFVGRRKFNDEYIVDFELTVYNDNDHTTTERSAHLLREGMKWVIAVITP